MSAFQVLALDSSMQTDLPSDSPSCQTPLTRSGETIDLGRFLPSQVTRHAHPSNQLSGQLLMVEKVPCLVTLRAKRPRAGKSSSHQRGILALARDDRQMEN